MDKKLKAAYQQAQEMANTSGRRMAIIAYAVDDYEVVKATYCEKNSIKILDVVRPEGMQPLKAYRNQEFQGLRGVAA